jgi:DNA-binding XRE family transcriptional regulator
MRDFQQVLATAIQIAPLPAFERDLLAVDHKRRYPMAKILAQVPGDTLAERARQIGVSRQTMYVWAQEKFRPSSGQAAIIAKLTGVPAEQIGEYQEDKHETRANGAGKTPRKTRGRVAKTSRSLPPSAARVPGAKRRMVAQQGKRGPARTVRKRSAKRPVGGEAD